MLGFGPVGEVVALLLPSLILSNVRRLCWVLVFGPVGEVVALLLTSLLLFTRVVLVKRDQTPRT